MLRLPKSFNWRTWAALKMMGRLRSIRANWFAMERGCTRERQLHKLRDVALHRSAKVITRRGAEDMIGHTIAELLKE
jgi:hypothetical protein